MEDPTSPQIQKRNVAIKISITALQASPYVKEEGMVPNYVNTSVGKVFRVNMIGVVVSKEEGLGFDTVVIDDSSSSITLRSFEDREILKRPKIGDLVLVIGKPREYNGEKYVLPEIVRKIEDKNWAVLRRIELQNITPEKINKGKIGSDEEPIAQSTLNPNEKETSHATIDPELNSNANNIILSLIKELDDGSGVPYEVLIDSSKLDDCEEVIKTLLEEGEIFEIRPGILKCL